MSNDEFSYPPSLSYFFSLNPSFLLYHSFLPLCSEWRRGGVCRFTCVTVVRGRKWCCGSFYVSRQSSYGNFAPSGPCLWGQEGDWGEEMTGEVKERQKDRGTKISEYRKAEAYDDEWYTGGAQTSVCLLNLTTTTLTPYASGQEQ